MLKNVWKKLINNGQPESDLEDIEEADFHTAFGADQMMLVTGIIRTRRTSDTKTSLKKKLHNMLKKMA
jgi:hypothetical protein